MNPFRPAVNGRCNVCLRTEMRLTRDHVPPSGVIGGRRQARVRQPLQEQLVDRNPRIPTQLISRTGVYFTTVCSDCHRARSGDDDALIGFVNNARNGLVSRPRIIDIIAIRARPDAVIRAILFHNLTSRLDVTDSVFETSIRAVIRDGNVSAGRALFLYIWCYSGNDIFMMHDFVTPNNALPMPIGSVLSFPPLTFFLAAQQVIGVRGLNVECTLNAPEEQIPINLHVDPTGVWPRSAIAVMGGARMAEHIVADQD